jgi:hypothetical protein
MYRVAWAFEEATGFDTRPTGARAIHLDGEVPV